MKREKKIAPFKSQLLNGEHVMWIESQMNFLDVRLRNWCDDRLMSVTFLVIVVARQITITIFMNLDAFEKQPSATNLQTYFVFHSFWIILKFKMTCLFLIFYRSIHFKTNNYSFEFNGNCFNKSKIYKLRRIPWKCFFKCRKKKKLCIENCSKCVDLFQKKETIKMRSIESEVFLSNGLVDWIRLKIKNISIERCMSASSCAENSRYFLDESHLHSDTSLKCSLNVKVVLI